MPPVHLLPSGIATTQMPGVYASVDCFVLPSRGEGWGRPHVEAMSMGLPVIATHWSGPSEFLNEENGYPLRHESLEPIPEGPFKGHKWAKPDVTVSKKKIAILFGRVRQNRFCHLELFAFSTFYCCYWFLTCLRVPSGHYHVYHNFFFLSIFSFICFFLSLSSLSNEQHLRSLMRRVYHHPEEGRARGQIARRDMQTKYCPDCVAELVLKELIKIQGLHLNNATTTSTTN